MDKERQIQNFINYVTNKAKPLFVSLIREATRENQFPVITDAYDSPFRELFESSVDSLWTIIHSLTSRYYPFKELYDVCLSSLCKDDTLDRVVTVCAEFLRKRFPSISVKGKVSSFASQIRNYERYLLPVILLSSLNLTRWTFNEAETANIMIATVINSNLNSGLEGYLELFKIYKNAGVDLSHLDHDKVVKGFHKTYLLYLCNKVTIAFFFYRNEKLRNAFANTLKLKALVNSESTGRIVEDIKKIDGFTKILGMIAPSESKSLTDEKKKIIEDRVKAEIKSLLNRCLAEDTFPFVSNWKSDISYGFQKVIDQLEVEIRNLDVQFNFNFLKNCYERSIEKSYREIIELMAEEAFNTTLVNEIANLVAYITAWKVVHHVEEVYRKFPLIDFLYSFANKIRPYKIIGHVCYRPADELVEKLRKASNTIKEKIREIKKSKSLSLEEITSYVRKKLGSRIFYQKAENQVNNIDTSSYERFKETLNHSVDRLFRYYSNNDIDFESFIAALTRISQVINTNTEDRSYAEYFVRKINRKKKLNDIYRTIITGMMSDGEVLKKVKGLYFLFVILDALKQEFDKLLVEFSENHVYITKILGITDILILALITAELLKLHRERNESNKITEELLKITVNSEGLPVPENVAVFRLENTGNYFSPLITTQPDGIEVKTNDKESPRIFHTQPNKIESEEHVVHFHGRKVVQLALPF